MQAQRAIDDVSSLNAIDVTALEGTATDAGPPPDHDLVEVAAGAADVGVLDLHGELDFPREAARRRRRERRLVHVEPRRDEVEAERRGPARDRFSLSLRPSLDVRTLLCCLARRWRPGIDAIAAATLSTGPHPDAIAAVDAIDAA